MKHCCENKYNKCNNVANINTHFDCNYIQCMYICIVINDNENDAKYKLFEMIKESVIQLIRKNKKVKGLLQAALDIAPATMQRYLDNNDIMLTTKVALDVITKELGLKEKEVLEKETAA